MKRAILPKKRLACSWSFSRRRSGCWTRRRKKLSNPHCTMHFQLSEEHLMIQKAARDFAQNECLPGVIDRDEQQRFPKEQVMKLAELGFMGMMVDPEYGGAGMDTISYVLAMEEVSKVDASVSVCMSVNNSLVCWGLDKYGTDAQKRK